MHPPIDIDCDRSHAALAVPDLRAAIEFYTGKLGFRLSFTWGDPPTFAGLTLGEAEMFLQQGKAAPEGCSVFFVVGDADELFAFHSGNGVDVAEAIDDRPWGLRDYAVRDLNGYHLVFGHHLMSAGPREKIERVDVPVRLEKRLAALLADLAEHKRMSVSSCLEEILLHTNEPLGDGVASPHTKRQLAYIQELKRKHGIDYDSHASYRWEE